MNKLILARVLALAFLTFAASAAAQTSVYDLPEKLVDGNGVDLASEGSPSPSRSSTSATVSG